MMNLLFVFTLFISAGFAKELPILKAQEIYKIVGRYPSVGSEAEAEDFRVLLEWQANRTEAQCGEASSQERASFVQMFAANNGPLTVVEAEKIAEKMDRYRKAATTNNSVGKEHFRRPRPYVYHAEVVPCVRRETSFAYPSGHSTVARVSARILSKLYPARAEAIMKRGDEIALNRVLGGVHHPTDIEAGKKLGDHLAALFLAAEDITDLE